jgi:hypothetical protein
VPVEPHGTGTARKALVDGMGGAVWEPRGKSRFVLESKIRNGRIAETIIRTDPVRLIQLDLVILGD